MRSANPALNAGTFQGLPRTAGMQDAMTIQGAVNKTGLMLILLILTASYTWGQFFRLMDMGDPAGVSALMPLFLGGMIGGLIAALVTMFKKTWSPITAPIYALCQGLFLGGLSAMFEARYPGIVIQAVALTFGTLFALLMAYKSGAIRPNENFKLGLAAATGGIFLVYMANLIFSFFSPGGFGFMHQPSLFGIGFSLFVVIIAALNLVLDFDFIEHGAEAGAPRYMEWFAAFGLMVTLIWLYIEFLRLLAKLNDRRS
ncbi:Bax inhibitor-1/YccA family protein [bacterium]|nr:Bax inhibitor-1/YccA family protein [bacterium]